MSGARDRIADANRSFLEHPRVQATPSRVGLLRDAADVAALERAGDVVARRRIVGELEADLADIELRAGNHLRPRDALEREVLADRAGADRMAFALQRGDQVLGEEAHRAVGTAVVSKIALTITL